MAQKNLLEKAAALAGRTAAIAGGVAALLNWVLPLTVWKSEGGSAALFGGKKRGAVFVSNWSLPLRLLATAGLAVLVVVFSMRRKAN